MPGNMIEHEAFGWENLPEDAVIGIVPAIGSVHHEAPVSAGPQVELFERVGESFRPPPLCQMGRVGPGTEDEFARCIEDARADDLGRRGGLLIQV